MEGRVEAGRLREILEAAARVRVLVVGDLMLDRYVTGRVDRVSPEAPVPVVRVDAESTAVGGAGNVAANVAALGAGCDLVGCVGRDVHGRMLLEAVEEAGVGVGGIVVTDTRPTTVKTRVLARRQQVVRVDREVDHEIGSELASELERIVGRLAGESDAVAVEDYDKGVLVDSVVRETLKAGSRQGVPTVVDPKRIRFFGYPGASVFKPNARELSTALGARLRPDDPKWMESVRDRLECRNLLLTLGDAGMALQTEDGAHRRIPAEARDVYDVSGAGDTVTAALATALAAGATPEEAATLANHAAAVQVGKVGVATVRPVEIMEQNRHGEEA